MPDGLDAVEEAGRLVGGQLDLPGRDGQLVAFTAERRVGPAQAQREAAPGRRPVGPLHLEGVSRGRGEMVSQVLADGFYLVRGGFHVDTAISSQAEGSARRDLGRRPGDDSIHIRGWDLHGSLQGGGGRDGCFAGTKRGRGARSGRAGR